MNGRMLAKKILRIGGLGASLQDGKVLGTHPA